MKTHITVLRDEAVEALAIKKTHIVVDATLGAGGHSHEIVKRLGEGGTLVAIDADQTAVENAKQTLTSESVEIKLVTGNFRDIDSIIGALNMGKVQGILADLGWRMEQFSGNGKGFSFQVDEPLIMTYGDPDLYPFTARDIVNDWDEKDIQNVLKGYGEERYAYKIAQKIVARREQFSIETTKDLVSVIDSAVPSVYRHGRIHPATKTFQALRIAVNDEFEALQQFIHAATQLLLPNGKLAIITFHSGEDRIVKHLFRELAHDHVGTVCTKKPITATEEELTINPRARSAKLRVFEKN